jgi:hypothetical protein
MWRDTDVKKKLALCFQISHQGMSRHGRRLLTGLEEIYKAFEKPAKTDEVVDFLFVRCLDMLLRSDLFFCR